MKIALGTCQTYNLGPLRDVAPILTFRPIALEVILRTKTVMICIKLDVHVPEIQQKTTDNFRVVFCCIALEFQVLSCQ
jgi:hypothetical protein